MRYIVLYGSRYTLIPLMRITEQLNIEINRAYLGSSLTSQYAKTQKIDSKHVKKLLNQYEELEILNDRLKLFRRFIGQSESKVIIIDFLYEGYEVVNSNNGRLTLSTSNQKYNKKSTDYKYLRIDTRMNLIEDNLKTFMEYLKGFDTVILNKLRLPKYDNDKGRNLVQKENIQHINVMNSIITSYEDIILNKLSNVHVIPLHENHEAEGYWFSPEYLNHVKEHMNKFDF